MNLLNSMTHEVSLSLQENQASPAMARMDEMVSEAPLERVVCLVFLARLGLLGLLATVSHQPALCKQDYERGRT